MLENLLIVGGIVALVILVGFVMLYAKWFKKPSQGQAFIITGRSKEPKVKFTGAVVIPVLNKLEIMDISLKSFTLERLGKEGLICKDNLRADIKVTFFIKVDSSEAAVLEVAQSIGADRASDKGLLMQLFDAKFSEALKTAGKGFNFVDLYSDRNGFKTKMMDLISNEDLNGYSLESAAIDYLEQTDIKHLDPNNILDSEGITKITKLTAEQHKLTNQLENNEKEAITLQNKETNIRINNTKREEEQEIKQKDTDSRLLVLDYEKTQAEKEENQRKEIELIKTRAKAEQDEVTEQERLRAAKAKIETDQEIAISEEKSKRERIIETKRNEALEAKQTEKVEEERALAATEREKLVNLAEIAKEKELEVQKRDIQGIIKSRLELENETKVAEQNTQDMLALAEADRSKTVAIKKAEQEAEVALVQEIKAAEANKKAAELKAEQEKLEAEVEREVVDKKAEAKKIMADATAEEASAMGLSEARVMEAKSEALAKQGEAEASVIQQKSLAEAEGIKAKQAAENEAFEEKGEIEAKILEQTGQAEANVLKEKGMIESQLVEEQGMAEIRLIELKADAVKKQGMAEAEVEKEKKAVEVKILSEKGLAEAKVLEDKGLAEAKVIDVQAEALKKQGLAEAEVTKQKAEAEANKIAAKAEAMKKLDGVGKEHEEFKLKLEKELKLELARVEIQKSVAESQAKAIAEAFKASNINIVGGETMFYNNIMSAIGRGKALDSWVDNSAVLTGVKDMVLNGSNGNGMMDKIKSLIGQFNLSSEDVKNLTVSALIFKMISLTKDDETKGLLDNLLKMAQKAGILDQKAGNFLNS